MRLVYGIWYMGFGIKKGGRTTVSPNYYILSPRAPEVRQ